MRASGDGADKSPFMSAAAPASGFLAARGHNVAIVVAVTLCRGGVADANAGMVGAVPEDDRRPRCELPQARGSWERGNSGETWRCERGRQHQPYHCTSALAARSPRLPSAGIPPEPAESLSRPHNATNRRSSSLFRLGGDAISQLVVKKPNKNNDTILRPPEG